MSRPMDMLVAIRRSRHEQTNRELTQVTMDGPPSALPRRTSFPTALRALIGGACLGLVLFGTMAFAWLRVVDRDRTGDVVGDRQTDPIALRPVRVLIGSAVERVRFRSPTGLTLRSGDGIESTLRSSNDWIECSARNGELCLGDALIETPLVLSAAGGEAMFATFHHDGSWTEAREYPGVLRLAISSEGGVTVINEVEVEPYVACVTANEVWPGFHEQTFRVQAITARTYVLYQMQRRRAAPFDVSATQGSQVYRGLRRDTTGEDAKRATTYTRGIALTWFDGTADRLFCAYYCAACGGRTQSAAIFGPESDLPPLAGGVPCDDCRIAPGQTYRWNTVELSLDEIFRRIAARFPSVSSWDALRSVVIHEAGDDGRAITVRLTGTDGRTEDLLAERFRLALGGSEIRSTHFTLRQNGNILRFENGRGFGHGLGLCQWGAEGQARQGRRAGAILRYYYPGAKLTRVYHSEFR